MAKRNVIGGQMARAAASVASNPGCSKLFVGSRLHIACAQGKNNALGYEPINRAIKAGLIVAKAGKGNSYALYAA